MCDNMKIEPRCKTDQSNNASQIKRDQFVISFPFFHPFFSSACTPFFPQNFSDHSCLFLSFRSFRMSTTFKEYSPFRRYLHILFALANLIPIIYCVAVQSTFLINSHRSGILGTTMIISEMCYTLVACILYGYVLFKPWGTRRFWSLLMTSLTLGTLACCLIINDQNEFTRLMLNLAQNDNESLIRYFTLFLANYVKNDLSIFTDSVSVLSILTAIVGLHFLSLFVCFPRSKRVEVVEVIHVDLNGPLVQNQSSVYHTAV